MVHEKELACESLCSGTLPSTFSLTIGVQYLYLVKRMARNQERSVFDLFSKLKMRKI